jgi:hypothetical protein
MVNPFKDKVKRFYKKFLRKLFTRAGRTLEGGVPEPANPFLVLGHPLFLYAIN